MSWQLLTIISVVAVSFSVLLRRLLLHDNKSDPVAYAVVFQGLVGVITGVYALAHGFQMPDFGRYWLVITITTLLYAAGHVVSAKALQKVEASVFAVLFASSAIWTMLGSAIVFHDRLDILQLLGVLLVFVSIGVLVERKGSLKIDVGVVLGLATGMLLGIATVGWVYVGRNSDTASWTALSFIGPALVVLAIKPKSVLKMKPFTSGKVLLRMLLLSIVFSISAITAMLAYTKGSASLVVALQQTSIVVTTILAIVLLRERTRLWHKAAAALICFVAILLII